MELTGYPSIDKPWLKYYSEEAIWAKLPDCSMYEYVYECNNNHLDDIAVKYFNKSFTYKRIFESIDKTANARLNLLIKQLAEKENIESRPVWKPMHMQPVFKQYDFIKVENKAVSEDLFKRGVCLPSDTKMTKEEQDKIIEIINNLWK